MTPLTVRMRCFFCLVVLSACGPRVPASWDTGEDFLCKYSLYPSTLQAGTLRLADGPVIATVKHEHSAGLDLKLPEGDASRGARTRFTSGWVTLDTVLLAERGFRLHTLKEVALSPVLFWPEGGELTWKGGSDHTGVTELELEAETPAWFRPAAPLIARLPCDKTTIANVGPKGLPFDDAKAKPVEVTFPAGELAVSATPGGKPEGWLRRDADDFVPLEVVETKGDFLKVTAQLWPGRVEGWVQKSKTAEHVESANLLGGIGLGGLAARGKGEDNKPRCSAEAKLHVSVNGTLHPVGLLRKKAAVKPGTAHDGWVEVALPELDWVKLEPGTQWALLDENLKRCAIR